MQMQLYEVNDDVNDIIVRERNLEIRQLEREVSLIAEIMTEMSTFVQSQGEQLDMASDNVEHANEELVVAVKSLEQSMTLQSTFRKWVIGAVVASAGITVSGGLLAILSLPIGLATMGIGMIGAAVTITTAISK